MSASNVTKPPVVQPGTGNNIIVNPCQRGNPILECIKNVGKEFGDIVTDYQVGRTTGVLFLSLRYHRLHPEYIHQRIERLGHSYSLRILLLMCDVSEHQEPIKELTKICLINNITIMVAWNAEEAGFYLSTYKQFEHKPPDLIKERVDKDYYSMLRTALTSVSKVNKTDVETLRISLGGFSDIARASSDQLQNLPGFGQVKAKRLKDAFEKPFRNSASSDLPQLLSQHSSHAATADEGKVQGSDACSPAVESGMSTTVEQRAAREPSPVWDIELDLNGSPSPTPETGPAPHRSQLPSPSKALPTRASSTSETDINSTQSKKRPPSPVWDIELDLNESDEDNVMDNGSKKRKLDDTFGEPSILHQLP